MKPTAQMRLESKLSVSKNGCLEWTGCKSTNGYGKIAYGPSGVSDYAHRVAYRIYKGKIPPGAEVMHSCDNKLCCRPSHLSAGTHAENMADLFSKGKHAFGLRSGNAKLTEEQVLEIRSRREYKTETAKEFGVSPSLVAQIQIGKVWKRLCFKEFK